LAGKEPKPIVKEPKSLHPISYMSPHKTIKSFNEALKGGWPLNGNFESDITGITNFGG